MLGTCPCAGAMEQIKDIVSKVIAGLSAGKPQTQWKIQKAWTSVCDKKTLNHTAIAGLQKGELTVHVDTPTWLFHMNLHKRKLLDGIKKEAPEILNVHFRIGKI